MSYASYKNIGRDLNAPPPESLNPVIKIQSNQHRSDIINNNDITVVDNYTEWCGPCKQIAPQYSILSQKYQGRCALVVEDVDDEIEGAMEIRGVPCFHFYVRGKFMPTLTITGGDIPLVEETLQKIMQKV